MIPLFHELSGVRVVVFGGGRVGARKARGFASEADVLVVSPHFADVEFGGADLIRARPDPTDVAGWLDRAAPEIVVAATDRAALNAAIEREARDRGVLVNRADRGSGHEPGDVAMAATYRDEPVVVAVGTQGTSPALSRYLRQQFQAEFAGAGAVAEAMAAVRDSLGDDDLDPGTRRTVLRRVVADDRLWAAARNGATDLEELARACAAEHRPADTDE